MQEMVERYLAAWNETDASRRRKLVDELWAQDGSYTDPLADAHGRAEIAGLIGAVQQQFPDFVFTLGGPVDAHHEQARFKSLILLCKACLRAFDRGRRIQPHVSTWCRCQPHHSCRQAIEPGLPGSCRLGFRSVCIRLFLICPCDHFHAATHGCCLCAQFRHAPRQHHGHQQRLSEPHRSLIVSLFGPAYRNRKSPHIRLNYLSFDRPAFGRHVFSGHAQNRTPIIRFKCPALLKPVAIESVSSRRYSAENSTSERGR